MGPGKTSVLEVLTLRSFFSWYFNLRTILILNIKLLWSGILLAAEDVFLSASTNAD